MTAPASREVERLARLSYGRLVALLARRTGSLALAEDALSDALVAALTRWPGTAVPDNPEGWLLATARNRAIDTLRRDAMPMRHWADLERLAGQSHPPETESDTMDHRLPLMFACTHPAIDPAIRAPLILQVVLGLDARRIAGAFLVAPATLGQRLSRAKARIGQAAIGFDLPSPSEWPDRLGHVLDAIYAGYALGAGDRAAGDTKIAGLAQEALWLASIAAHALPDEAEAHGLLALILFAEARREAGTDPATGAFLPLDRQDTGRWNADMIDDARAALLHAASRDRLGRYQVEAAIQAVHAARRESGRTEWPELLLLYRGLVALAPSSGAQAGLAVVTARVHGPAEGLAALDEIAEPQRSLYQPYWATRAHLLAELGRNAEAADAYDRAIGLTEDATTRAFLAARRCALFQG